MGSIMSLLAWPMRKLAYAALLAALGFVGAGLWIFLHDGNDFETSHRNAVRKIEAENATLKAALADSDARLAKTRTEIAASQLRADQAAKVAHNLDELSGGLNRITTSSAQLKENDERLARMKQMEADSRKRVADLDQSLVRIQWEKDGIELALQRNRAQAAAVATGESPFLYFVRRAWTDYGKAVLVGVVVVMLLPPLWRFWRFTRS
jgi:chromosome segregation ATPase